MRGMVTQTRELDLPPAYVKKYDGAGKLISSMKATMPCDQTTTSFRSGRGEMSDDEQIRELQAQRKLSLENLYPVPQDIGHPFSTVKRVSFTSHKSWTYRDVDNGPGARIEGPLVLSHRNQDVRLYYPPNEPLTANQIAVHGASAIRASSPTKPEAGVSTFLGELSRDGIPSLIGLSLLRSRSATVQKAAGEYLNVEFGWKPLVSDIRKIATAVVNSSLVFKQYRRDSGRLIRRRLSFPRIDHDEVVTSSSWPDYGGPFLGYSSYEMHMGLCGQTVLQRTSVTEEYSFAGAFSYYLNVGDSQLSKLGEFEQLANKLLGTRLTPDVLWELAPWSWLVDWLSNVGPILSNASMFTEDGLVMKYGYLMRHTVAQTDVSLPNVVFHDGTKAGTVTNTFHSSRKERVRATPYGFGLNTDAFSVRQWAILGALGMTKAPRTAW